MTYDRILDEVLTLVDTQGPIRLRMLAGLVRGRHTWIADAVTQLRAAGLIEMNAERTGYVGRTP